jgi:uncharacterized protein (DUF736 family)
LRPLCDAARPTLVLWITGTVRTLTLNVKVKFVPNAKESENAPD